ncbi:MAG TPA: hypothetical protein VGS79_17915 [Puia sp.]|nr:hypothetical protein [Puia sp.]
MGILEKTILDWSEAWAPLVPLAIRMRHRTQPSYLRPVVIYVWFAFFCNVAIDVVWKLSNRISVPYNSNNWLYNLHSVVRFGLFAAFFLRLRQPFIVGLKRAVAAGFAVFVVVDFGWFERFFEYQYFSSRLLAMEAGLLLFYCLQYYFYKLREDVELEWSQPDFWVVTGLGIYVAINFLIFLTYNELSAYYTHFAVDIWSVHNISYVLFQFFLAKAFYESTRR